MKQITITQFKHLTVKELVDSLPLTITITVDERGETPVAVVGKPDEVIIVSDLHPIMRTKLLNIEKLARGAG